MIREEATALSKLAQPQAKTQSDSDVVIAIQPSRGWRSLNLGQVWAYRELLYFMIWRDVKVRYKQAALGIAWAVLQPLATMAIFSVVFGAFAKVPSDGLPYTVFTYTALLPWNLFASALTRSALSIVGQSNLISKVYFPRLIVPLSATLSGVIDFVVAFVLLLGMLAYYAIVPGWRMAAVPLFVVLTLLTALAVGLWLAALNVKYRDVGHVVPFVVQFWMFASPIVYSVSIVPEKWRWLYGLNPMVGIVEGFRWALLGKESPGFGMMVLSTVFALVLLLSGLIYFRRVERTFADIV